MDGLKRYVNDDRFRVDGDKNMRLLAFAFTIVFVWTGPKSCRKLCIKWTSEISNKFNANQNDVFWCACVLKDKCELFPLSLFCCLLFFGNDSTHVRRT